ARSVVVLVAEDARVEDLGGRRERNDGGIDAQLRDLARENRRRIEVCECGRRRRIGEIVCRDVDRLHRRDRSLLRRRDALLQLAHFRREVRLVADGARHASEKRRHFRSRLREAEDVVDEEQHVLPFDVAEVFGDGEAGETNAQTRTRRLRHLSVDQSSLRVRRIARHDDLRLFELEIEVVSFARTLTDAREHGEAGALLRDVVDELHDQNGLADTGAAEQAGLAALGVRFEKVDDLDARLEHLDVGRLFVEGGRLAMDGPVSFRVHRTFVVDWLPENVQDAAERLPSDRNGDRRTEIDRLHAADHSVRRLHRDATNLVLTDVVRDFDDDIDLHFAELTVIDDANRVVDRRKVTLLELDVDRRADDLNDFSDVLICHVFSVSELTLCCRGARHDLDDLLRDRGLTNSVVGERQMTDHLRRVLRCRFHRGHARALFGGRGLEKDAIELELDVLRQEIFENRLRPRLIKVIDRILQLVPGTLQRKHAHDAHLLRDQRLEFVVDDVDGIDLAADEVFDEVLPDLLRRFQRQRLEDMRRLTADRNLAALEEIVRLASDGEKLHRLEILFANEVHRRANDVRVERATKTSIGRHWNDQHVPLDVVRFEQRMSGHIDTRRNGGEHLAQRGGVRPRREHPFLRAAQLRRGHHLHGLGDLLRVLDAADAAPDINCAGHIRYATTTFGLSLT